MVNQSQYLTSDQAKDLFASKADLAEVKAELVRDMGKLESRLIRWMIAFMFGTAGLTVGLIQVVALFLK